MKVSSKVRYALRAMIELGVRGGEIPIMLGEIAKSQEISRKYLETLLGRLKGAGLIESIRGKQGGYLLAKPAQEITVLEIYQAVDGKLLLVSCLEGDCERSAGCITTDLWGDLNDLMVQFLSDKNLGQLVELYQDKQQNGSNMYYI